MRLLLSRALAPAALFVATFVALLSWGVSSPVGSSPDDAFHMASIWCADDQPGRVCSETKMRANPGTVVRRIPAQLGSVCYAFDSTKTGVCTRELPDRLVRQASNDGLYPAGYYEVLNQLVRGSVPQAILLMRAVNALLGAGLITVALVVATGGLRRAGALSWLVCLSPLTMFLLPSVNPSSWAVVSLGTFWIFLVQFLSAPRGARGLVAAAGAVVTAALALNSRTDAAAYLCVVTLAAMVLTSPGNLRDLRRWRYVLPVVLGLAGFLRFVTSQSSSVLVTGASPLQPAPGREGLDLLITNVLNLPSLLAGVFGQSWGLGWLDTPIPPGYAAIACALPFALVVLASGSFWPRKLVAVTLVAVVLCAVPLAVLQPSHSIIGETVQPRYVLPLVPALIGMVLYTSEDARGPQWTLRLVPAWMLALGAGLVNAMSLHTNLRRYVVGLDDMRWNFDPQVEWWWDSAPVSPMAVWAVGTVAGFALAAVLTRWALRAQRTLPTAGETGADAPLTSREAAPAVAG